MMLNIATSDQAPQGAFFIKKGNRMKNNYVPGCVYIIKSKEEKDKLLESGHFSIIKTCYLYKPKWQFWKKKQVGYYEMMYKY